MVIHAENANSRGSLIQRARFEGETVPFAFRGRSRESHVGDGRSLENIRNMTGDG